MNQVEIRPYEPRLRASVLELTLEAWTPVMGQTKLELPRFVYDAFYPEGWQVRQTADVAGLLDDEPQNIWVAAVQDELAGFVGLRLHPEDSMGEIYILAVSPKRQRLGVGQALMRFAEQRFREAGMAIIMVETIDDAGHYPARRLYEAVGFERWPVARYFKQV